MSKFIDLTGQKFGRLTVIKRAESRISKTGQHKTMFLCKCDCGNEICVSSSNLKSGYVKSCGCYQQECRIKNNTSHGMSKTRLYKIWKGIKRRCINKNYAQFQYYGGRGITICDEWENNYLNFYNWAINNGYDDYLSIDRIDLNRNYEPNNCRWVDKFKQANNKRNNHYITYNGETHTIAEWGNLSFLTPKQIQKRLRLGWDVQKIFTTPIR